MSNKYTAADVASYYLTKDRLTPKKLQKLVYYAYSWVLVFFNDDPDNLNEKLFNDPIEAWVHGPVVATLYSKYMGNGYEKISKLQAHTMGDMSEELKDVLDQVWGAYGHLDGNQLEGLTHSERPWIEARGELTPFERSNNRLSDKTIFEFYAKKLEDEAEETN